MSSIKETARRFFDACETGQGWQGCRQHCHSGATFSAQADALGDVRTLQAYTDWMKGLFGPVPDGRYELRVFAVDDGSQQRHRVQACSAAPIRVKAGRCHPPESA